MARHHHHRHTDKNHADKNHADNTNVAQDENEFYDDNNEANDHNQPDEQHNEHDDEQVHENAKSRHPANNRRLNNIASNNRAENQAVRNNNQRVNNIASNNRAENQAVRNNNQRVNGVEQLYNTPSHSNDSILARNNGANNSNRGLDANRFVAGNNNRVLNRSANNNGNSRNRGNGNRLNEPTAQSNNIDYRRNGNVNNQRGLNANRGASNNMQAPAPNGYANNQSVVNGSGLNNSRAVNRFNGPVPNQRNNGNNYSNKHQTNNVVAAEQDEQDVPQVINRRTNNNNSKNKNIEDHQRTIREEEPKMSMCSTSSYLGSDWELWNYLKTVGWRVDVTQPNAKFLQKSVQHDETEICVILDDEHSGKSPYPIGLEQRMVVKRMTYQTPEEGPISVVLTLKDLNQPEKDAITTPAILSPFRVRYTRNMERLVEGQNELVEEAIQRLRETTDHTNQNGTVDRDEVHLREVLIKALSNDASFEPTERELLDLVVARDPESGQNFLWYLIRTGFDHQHLMDQLLEVRQKHYQDSVEYLNELFHFSYLDPVTQQQITYPYTLLDYVHSFYGPEIALKQYLLDHGALTAQDELFTKISDTLWEHDGYFTHDTLTKQQAVLAFFEQWFNELSAVYERTHQHAAADARHLTLPAASIAEFVTPLMKSTNPHVKRSSERMLLDYYKLNKQGTNCQDIDVYDLCLNEADGLLRNEDPDVADAALTLLCLYVQQVLRPHVEGIPADDNVYLTIEDESDI